MNPTSEARRAKWRKKYNETMSQGFYFWRDLKEVIAGKKRDHKKHIYDAYLGHKTGFDHAPFRKAMGD
jgi:hypothetical protein